MEEKKKFSIDIAIDACIEKIKEHQRKANKFLLQIIIALMFFVSFYLLQSFFISQNQRKLISLKSDLQSYISKLSNTIPTASFYYAELKKAVEEIKDTADIRQESAIMLYNNLRSDTKVTQLTDSLYSNERAYTDIILNLKTLPDRIDTDWYTVDHTSNYILYGIFILIFGVLTSFYRHHIKEVSKFEHYRIAFERIRIAGYNSTSKYDGEVLKALTVDVFAFETKAGSGSKARSVESPIPGYPTSDIVTSLLNKILDGVDVVPKSKQ